MTGTRRPWEDAALPVDARLAALLEAAGEGRGALKRLGEWLEAHGDDDLWSALRGTALGKGAEGIEVRDGRRWLKAALAREVAAQVRTNPIRRDEAFTCVVCGSAVPAHGRTARDHCPHCLASLHVDVVPGDRAADCGGTMRAVSVEMRHGETILRYRCAKCGHERPNRVLRDGDPPDAWDVVLALAAAR